MNKNESEQKSPPLIRGWDYTYEDYIKAWRDKKLLTAQIENTNKCNLNCEYCFRGGTSPESKNRFKNEITNKILFDSIYEMAELGVKTINIIGAGEPLMDKNIKSLLKYISELKIIPVIATNGSMITSELIDIFQKYNTSIVVKLNSMNKELQDKLTQKKDYSEKRDYGLKLLIDAGFNVPAENYNTRLGINSIVFRDNKDEVLDILRYCRNNNIMPIMSTFIPIGRTKDKTDQEISLKEFLEISKKAQKQDLEEYNIEYKRVLPYLGGVPCTQCGKASIYLTITGDIYDCPGQLHHYGNIRNTTIKEAFEKSSYELDNDTLTCIPRLKYWEKTGHITDEDTMNILSSNVFL